MMEGVIELPASRLRKKGWLRAEAPRSVPQELKPAFILLGICRG